MEHKKGGYQEAEEDAQSLAKEYKEHGDKGGVDIPRSDDRLLHRPCNEVQINDAVQEHQKEVLVVLEAHAIVDPGTMVVHLQDASSAHSAMVASVWLVLATPLAVTALT